MESVDGVYNAKSRKIDYSKLLRSVDSVTDNCNLRNGLRTLLQERPNKRIDIFHEWKVDSRSFHVMEWLEKPIDREIPNSGGFGSPFNNNNASFTSGNMSRSMIINRNQHDLSTSNALNSTRGNNPALLQPTNIYSPMPANSINTFSQRSSSPYR